MSAFSCWQGGMYQNTALNGLKNVTMNERLAFTIRADLE